MVSVKVLADAFAQTLRLAAVESKLLVTAKVALEGSDLSMKVHVSV